MVPQGRGAGICRRTIQSWLYVLEAKGIEIGVVEGVLGMVCYEIRINGQSNHAGTTPMPMRKDPMLAAAKMINDLHEELGKLDEELVYTFGRMNVKPNIHTVIPNEVVFTIDSRHKDPHVMKQVENIRDGEIISPPIINKQRENL